MGGEIQFYLEVVDLDDHVLTIPDEPVFARPGEPLALYSLALDSSPSPLEISEVVSYNFSSLRDEYKGTPDWVEVRNLLSEPLALAGWSLAHNLGDNARYDFPAARVLAPGEHFIVFCDNGNDIGPLHAPFGLNRSGTELMLIKDAPDGTHRVRDWVPVPALRADEAYARIGARGGWRKTLPTPYAANAANGLDGVVRSDENGPAFTLIVATQTNRMHTVEYQTTLGEPVWHSLATFSGNGIEQTVTVPVQGRCFFRAQRK